DRLRADDRTDQHVGERARPDPARPWGELRGLLLDQGDGRVNEPAETQVSADEFRQLFERVSNWGGWGADDERGALNYLTPELVAAAAALVRDGRTVSLSRSLNTERGARNPRQAHHPTALARRH